MANDPKAMFDSGEISSRSSRRSSILGKMSNFAQSTARNVGNTAKFAGSTAYDQTLSDNAPELMKSHRDAAMLMLGGPIGSMLVRGLAERGKDIYSKYKSYRGSTIGSSDEYGGGMGGGGNMESYDKSVQPIAEPIEQIEETYISSDDGSKVKRVAKIRRTGKRQTIEYKEHSNKRGRQSLGDRSLARSGGVANSMISRDSGNSGVNESKKYGSSSGGLSKHDYEYITNLSKSIASALDRSDEKRKVKTTFGFFGKLGILTALPSISFLRTARYSTELPNAKKVGVLNAMNITLGLMYMSSRANSAETNRLLYDIASIAKAGLNVDYKIKKPSEVTTVIEAIAAVPKMAGRAAFGAAKLGVSAATPNAIKKLFGGGQRNTMGGGMGGGGYMGGGSRQMQGGGGGGKMSGLLRGAGGVGAAGILIPMMLGMNPLSMYGGVAGAAGSGGLAAASALPGLLGAIAPYLLPVLGGTLAAGAIGKLGYRGAKAGYSAFQGGKKLFGKGRDLFKNESKIFKQWKATEGKPDAGAGSYVKLLGKRGIKSVFKKGKSLLGGVKDDFTGKSRGSGGGDISENLGGGSGGDMSSLLNFMQESRRKDDVFQKRSLELMELQIKLSNSPKKLTRGEFRGKTVNDILAMGVSAEMKTQKNTKESADDIDTIRKQDKKEHKENAFFRGIQKLMWLKDLAGGALSVIGAGLTGLKDAMVILSSSVVSALGFKKTANWIKKAKSVKRVKGVGAVDDVAAAAGKGAAKVGKVGKAGKVLAKGAKGLGALNYLDAGISAYDDIKEGQSATAVVGRGAARAGGMWAGGALGAKGGAAAGGAIGAFFGGAGAIPGAAIGGVIGGLGGMIAGSYGGDYVAENYIGDKSLNKPGLLDFGEEDPVQQVPPANPGIVATAEQYGNQGIDMAKQYGNQALGAVNQYAPGAVATAEKYGNQAMQYGQSTYDSTKTLINNSTTDYKSMSQQQALTQMKKFPKEVKYAYAEFTTMLKNGIPETDAINQIKNKYPEIFNDVMNYYLLSKKYNTQMSTPDALKDQGTNIVNGLKEKAQPYIDNAKQYGNQGIDMAKQYGNQAMQYGNNAVNGVQNSIGAISGETLYNKNYQTTEQKEAMSKLKSYPVEVKKIFVEYQQMTKSGMTKIDAINAIQTKYGDKIFTQFMDYAKQYGIAHRINDLKSIALDAGQNVVNGIKNSSIVEKISSSVPKSMTELKDAGYEFGNKMQEKGGELKDKIIDEIRENITDADGTVREVITRIVESGGKRVVRRIEKIKQFGQEKLDAMRAKGQADYKTLEAEVKATPTKIKEIHVEYKNLVDQGTNKVEAMKQMREKYGDEIADQLMVYINKSAKLRHLDQELNPQSGIAENTNTNATNSLPIDQSSKKYVVSDIPMDVRKQIGIDGVEFDNAPVKQSFIKELESRGIALNTTSPANVSTPTTTTTTNSVATYDPKAATNPAAGHVFKKPSANPSGYSTTPQGPAVTQNGYSTPAGTGPAATQSGYSTTKPANSVVNFDPTTATTDPAAVPSKTPATSTSPSAKTSTGSANKPEVQQALIDELKAQGITDPTAIANVMAQIEAESNFRPRSEDVDKYSAKTLYRLFPKKFADVNAAQALVDQGPEAVGNHIYGSRMGNAADEGYKYRGRGLIQLTGKDNYTTYGKKLGLDLVSNPDLANDPAIAARIAAVYFADKQSHGANLSDINSIGKAVGYAGGQSETAKRAKLAENYKGQIASGSLGTAGSSSAAPAASATPSATPSIQEKPPQTASAITPEQIVDSQNVSDELSSARISNGVSKVVGDSNTKVADGLDKLNNNVAQVAVNTSSPVTNTVTTTNNTSNSNATNAQSNNSNESIPPEVYNLIFAQFDA